MGLSASKVGGIAAKESWPIIETQVEEGISVWNGSEAGAVVDSALQAAFVGRHKGGTVRPVVGIGR
jgi:hypothetical protein